jgi:hypothetical protein
MREIDQNCIKALRGDGQMGSKVFGALSELSRRNNSHRNVIATEMMVKVVKKTLDSSIQAKTWECFSSNARCETLDQLIIVFDEVGNPLKSPTESRDWNRQCIRPDQIQQVLAW